MAVTFAVVATPGPTQRSWVEQVRMLEDLGYAAVLVPDTLWTVSPFPALAAAAVAAPRIRLRTWVLAAPMRSPAAVVREAKALQQLSDGRFELGIGTGRPGAEDEAARLGMPWGSAPERIAQLETVVTAVRTGRAATARGHGRERGEVAGRGRSRRRPGRGGPRRRGEPGRPRGRGVPGPGVRARRVVEPSGLRRRRPRARVPRASGLLGQCP